jgi:hypothetical protein
MAADGTAGPGRLRTVTPDHQLPPGRGRGVHGDTTNGRGGLLDLVRSLAEDVGVLVRQEIDLAKMEVGHTARRLAADSAWIATGAAVAAVGGLCLVVALALGLGVLLGSYWLGTLITGVVLMALGGAFAFKGLRDLRKQKLVPRETTESLRQDAHWAREEASEFKERITKE